MAILRPRRHRHRRFRRPPRIRPAGTCADQGRRAGTRARRTRQDVDRKAARNARGSSVRDRYDILRPKDRSAPNRSSSTTCPIAGRSASLASLTCCWARRAATTRRRPRCQARLSARPRLLGGVVWDPGAHGQTRSRRRTPTPRGRNDHATAAANSTSAPVTPATACRRLACRCRSRPAGPRLTVRNRRRYASEIPRGEWDYNSTAHDPLLGGGRKFEPIKLCG